MKLRVATFFGVRRFVCLVTIAPAVLNTLGVYAGWRAGKEPNGCNVLIWVLLFFPVASGVAFLGIAVYLHVP